MYLKITIISVDSLKNKYPRPSFQKKIRMSLKNPSEFLKRWAFRQKYAFLRNNLDKLYLFKPDTVTSMLKVYDYMEEFEQLRNGDPQLILPNNLEHAQNEIPITISLLEKEPVF